MSAAFTDRFSDFQGTRGTAAVAARRTYPRIVTRPDIRINALDPTYYKYKRKVVPLHPSVAQWRPPLLLH